MNECAHSCEMGFLVNSRRDVVEMVCRCNGSAEF
jgi:hypothetical protein